MFLQYLAYRLFANLPAMKGNLKKCRGTERPEAFRANLGAHLPFEFLTDIELLPRIGNFENHFVERKTTGDKKDWIKTVAAFANSAPDGYPCVLYLGVKDNGDIETPQANLDTLQKTFNREMDEI
jgi:hypothetical protein